MGAFLCGVITGVVLAIGFFIAWVEVFDWREREWRTKAKVWDEGFDAGERDVFEHERTSFDRPCIQNPYRRGDGFGGAVDRGY